MVSNIKQLNYINNCTYTSYHSTIHTPSTTAATVLASTLVDTARRTPALLLPSVLLPVAVAPVGVELTVLVPVTVAVSEAELLVEVDEDEVAVEVEAGSAVSVASETVVVVPCEARTTMEVPSWVTTVTIGAFELLDDEGVAVIVLEPVIVDAVGIGRVEVASAIPLIPLSKRALTDARPFVASSWIGECLVASETSFSKLLYSSRRCTRPALIVPSGTVGGASSRFTTCSVSTPRGIGAANESPISEERTRRVQKLIRLLLPNILSM